MESDTSLWPCRLLEKTPDTVQRYYILVAFLQLPKYFFHIVNGDKGDGPGKLGFNGHNLILWIWCYCKKNPKRGVQTENISQAYTHPLGSLICWHLVNYPPGLGSSIPQLEMVSGGRPSPLFGPSFPLPPESRALHNHVVLWVSCPHPKLEVAPHLQEYLLLVSILPACPSNPKLWQKLACLH